MYEKIGGQMTDLSAAVMKRIGLYIKHDGTYKIYVHCSGLCNNDNANDKPIKSLLKGKGLLPPLGLARLDS
jgi:hypothetical protein